MADLAPLGYGRVKARFVAGVADSNDEGDAPDVVPLTGTVTFNMSASALRVVSAVPDPATVYPRPITVALDSEGYIFQNGSRLVPLQATDDPATNPTGLQWTVSFNLRTLAGDTVPAPAWNFELPRGAVVDLTAAAPMTAPAPNTVILKGEKGDKGDTGPTGPRGPQGVQGEPASFGSPVVVYVDDVANVPRPETSRPVWWIQRGSAYPLNMRTDDIFYAKTSSIPVEPVFASLYAAWDPATLKALGTGAAVASWADTKSAITLAQATSGLQPTLTVPGSGKPYVTFAGKAMSVAFASALTQPTTLLAVVRNTSLTTANTSSTHRTLFDSKTASKVRVQQSGSSTATALYRTTVGATTRSNSEKFATTDKQILALVLNGTAIGATGSDLYVNGTGGLSSALATTESFDGLTVGCNYTQATDSTLGAFAQAEVYDIRLYSGALPTAQLTALTNYMASKHGITL